MSTTAASLDPRRRSSPNAKRIATGLLAVAGCFAIVAFVIRASDADDIIANFAALGAGIGYVIALHVVVLACDGIAWRAFLAPEQRAPLADFLWARWVREATNLLLPVAQIGGEVVGARLLTLRGMTPSVAGASVVLDKLTEALSLIPFTLLGLLIMFAVTGRTRITEMVGFALIVAIAAIGAAALVPHASAYRAIRRRIDLWLLGSERPLLGQIAHFARTTRELYRPRRFAVATAWHLLGWMIGAGEVWLALAFMGHPISLAAALALESLGQAIISIGFMVPAAIGVQEGAYIAIGSALGLPPETALALSLVKRVRQIAFGVPGLCAWQAVELRRLLRIGQAGAVAMPRAVPSSHSNSYVRRFMRGVLRPLSATPLTPNLITWARIVSGLAACIACAIGQPLWNHAAALLWLASALLDRGDGEFARLTGRCTERGRLLDYHGDVIINALIFLAVGINLRHDAFGPWSIAMGVAAAVAIASAAILAEALELRIGEKTVPPRRGFDSDDILFVLVPIFWFGHLLLLLVGALLGGIAAAAYIWHRLARLSLAEAGRAQAIAGTADLSQLSGTALLP